MLPRCRIVQAQVHALTGALTEPFGIAGGARPAIENAIVTIELDDGTVGYGEAAPFPEFNGETLSGALEAANQACNSIGGLAIERWRTAFDAIADTTSRSPAARCAVETAVLDAMTRSTGLPLWAFFGGREASVRTDMTVVTGSVAHARAAAAAAAGDGFDTIKLKVGSATVGEDVERLLAIRDAAPTARLVIDANAGMTADDALALVSQAQARGATVALFEQPTAADDLDGLARVRSAGVRVAADESATCSADVVRLANADAADVVNIKVMKSGVAEALDMVACARTHGLGLMIGGLVETELCMTLSAALAAGVGGFEFVDLDTPFFLARPTFADANGRSMWTRRSPILSFEDSPPGLGLSPVAALGADI